MATDRDKEEFASFLSRTGALGKAHRRALGILRDSSRAENVSQEAALRVWKRWPRLSRKLHTDGQLLSYLLTTAVNIAIDDWRRTKREVAIPDDAEGAGAHEQVDPPSQEAELERRKRVGALVECLAERTERQRAYLIENLLDGLPAREIASRAGRRIGGVTATIAQTKAALRKCLERKGVLVAEP